MSMLAFYTVSFESENGIYVVLIHMHGICRYGLVQDCSNSIANALELLQSCTEPSMCCVNPWVIIAYWCEILLSHQFSAYRQIVDDVNPWKGSHA